VSLYGPNGTPVSAKEPEREEHTIGGAKLVVFSDPTVQAQMPIEVPTDVKMGGEAAVKEWVDENQTLVKVVQLTNAHNAYVHALVRECVALRGRLEALEANANTTELREPPLGGGDDAA
jgi:hypothetical protein